MIGDCDKRRNRKLLRPPTRVDAELDELARGYQTRKRISESLSPHRERPGDDPGQAAFAHRIELLPRTGQEPHHGRVHLGLRPERTGRDIEKPLEGEDVLQHDREPAVLGLRRLCDHAIDDLPLEHEVKVSAPARRSGNVEQELGRDVIREIAHDSQARWQGGKIELERIGLVYRQSPGGMEFAQARTQVPVDLDDMQMIESREQGHGQRAETWTDFDDMIASPWIDGANDALDDRRIVEKMLPESFPWSVPARRH